MAERPDPRDLVGSARIRIRSEHSDQILTEGDVIGFRDRPTLLLRHDDGTRSWWPADLPHEVVTDHNPNASVRDRILRGVRLNGSPRLLNLVSVVAPGCGVDRDEIIAVVWDLVREGVLDYGADARVTLTEAIKETR